MHEERYKSHKLVKGQGASTYRRFPGQRSTSAWSKHIYTMNYMAAHYSAHFYIFKHCCLIKLQLKIYVIKKYFKRENSVAIFKGFFFVKNGCFFWKNAGVFFKMTRKRPYNTNKFIPFLAKNMSTGTKATITIFWHF